jgi:signal peptidase
MAYCNSYNRYYFTFRIGSKWNTEFESLKSLVNKQYIPIYVKVVMGELFNRKKGKIMNVWIKAFLMTIIVIAVIKVSVYAATGLWTVGFSFQSASMAPNMQIGDLILVQSSQRTNITTYEDGKTLNYRSLNDYGDVIAYYPKGDSKFIPILHRAMYYVEEGKPMWPSGPPAPYAGYIAKGDNKATNSAYDQQGSVSYLQPVKKEWIIAVAKARIPFL